MPKTENIRGNLRQLVAHTIQRMKADQADTVMLGPIVLDADDNPYFVLVTGRHDGSAHIDKINARRREEVETLRGSITFAIVRELRAIVMHDFGDELDMAKLGEAMWPARFATIRAGLEAERAIRH